jgi:hypothetical protein
MPGPTGAAKFATVSLKAGFATAGGVMLARAGLAAFAVREPAEEKEERITELQCQELSFRA